MHVADFQRVGAVGGCLPVVNARVCEASLHIAQVVILGKLLPVGIQQSDVWIDRRLIPPRANFERIRLAFLHLEAEAVDVTGL